MGIRLEKNPYIKKKEGGKCILCQATSNLSNAETNLGLVSLCSNCLKLARKEAERIAQLELKFQPNKKKKQQVPAKPVKPIVREKDETKIPRSPPFDKGANGTSARTNKVAGASRQGGNSAGTTYAKSFNARLKKGF